MFGPRPRDTIASELELRIEELLQVQEMRAERRVNFIRLHITHTRNKITQEGGL